MTANKTDMVRNRVFRAILKGEYGPGEKIPTEREMTALTGTSRITIRRAYAELEAAGILERRQGRGTHIATVHQGHSAKADFVALLATVRDPFALEFVNAVESRLGQSEMLLVLKITDEDPGREEQAAMELVAKGIRSLIVWPSGRGFRAGTFERLRILGTNMVFFDRVRPGGLADYVGLDNGHALRTLVNAAQKAGRRELVFVGHQGLDADSDRQREDAFVQECEARGLAHHLVRVPWKGEIQGAVASHRRAWFAAPERQAAICVNDHVALAVRAVMGEGLATYGIDGLPDAIAAGLPTLVQPMEAMAQKALACLMDQQRRGHGWRAQEVYCKGELLMATQPGGAALDNGV